LLSPAQVEPRFVGAKARAAVSSYRALAPSECDADVIDYTSCSLEDEAAGKCGLSPQQFVDHFFVRSESRGGGRGRRPDRPRRWRR
jgi:hypothetical protein